MMWLTEQNKYIFILLTLFSCFISCVLAFNELIFYHFIHSFKRSIRQFLFPFTQFN